MNVRPKFWIHRSGRFWWGLLILVVLLTGWFLTVFSESEILRESSGPGGFSETKFSINDGGLSVSWNDRTLVGRGTSRSPAKWKISFHESRGLKLSPEWDWSDIANDPPKDPSRTYYMKRFRDLTVFFPLWIPLLGWIILWPLRMHRADKEEDARLRGQGYLEPEG